MARVRLFFLAVAVVFLSTAGASAGAAERPQVVVTTSILGDVVGQVVGSDAEVTVLMPRGSDPHSYAPSAAQAALIRRAELVVANGLGLEEGLASALRSARADGVRVFDVGPRLRPLSYATSAPTSAGRPDPHVWMDPRRMALAARLIAREVGRRASPPVRRRVAERADLYARRLLSLDRRAAALVSRIPLPARKLVTNHHNYGYFAHRYGFRVVGTVVPSGTTLASPSPADFAELAKTIRREGVRAIFVSSSEPRRLADALAREVGLDVRVVVLHGESLGPPGSEAATYTGLLASSAARISRALAP